MIKRNITFYIDVYIADPFQPLLWIKETLATHEDKGAKRCIESRQLYEYLRLTSVDTQQVWSALFSCHRPLVFFFQSEMSTHNQFQIILKLFWKGKHLGLSLYILIITYTYIFHTF